MHVIKFRFFSTFPVCKVPLIFAHITLLSYIDNISQTLTTTCFK